MDSSWKYQRICNPVHENKKSLENKGFPHSPHSDGRCLGSNSDEPLALIAGDELLVGLIENTDDALLSRLEPGLHFVVQHWPDLSEGDQQAILAIVRRAESGCTKETIKPVQP